MQVIKAGFHAVLDYLVVIFLVVSPSLFQFTPLVATLTYVLAAVHLILTILTNFPGGLIKILPLSFHSAIEVTVAIALVVMPWLFAQTNSVDRYFYTCFGIAVFMTWVLTDYTIAENDPRYKKV